MKKVKNLLKKVGKSYINSVTRYYEPFIKYNVPPILWP